VVIVCVPTPLAADGGPDLGAVEGAARTIGEHVRPGTLVVLESTTYPGTTEEVFAPLVTASGLRAGVASSDAAAAAASTNAVTSNIGSQRLRTMTR